MEAEGCSKAPASQNVVYTGGMGGVLIGEWPFPRLPRDLSPYVEEDVAATFLKYFWEVFLELLAHERIDNRVHTAVDEGNGFCDMGGIDQPLAHDASIQDVHVVQGSKEEYYIERDPEE